MPVPNDRYRAWLDSFTSPRHAHRVLIAHARANGTASAAEMSGAHIRTIQKLVQGDKAGTLHARPPGRPPLSAADIMRIARARAAHPKWGAKRLKEHFSLPYGIRQIKRILREFEMVRRWRAQTGDYATRMRKQHEKLAMFAGINGYLSIIGALLKMTGRMADFHTPMRRMIREARLAAWWEERERHLAARETTDITTENTDDDGPQSEQQM